MVRPRHGRAFRPSARSARRDGSRGTREARRVLRHPAGRDAGASGQVGSE